MSSESSWPTELVAAVGDALNGAALRVPGEIEFSRNYLVASLVLGIVFGGMASIVGLAKFDTRHRLIAALLLIFAVLLFIFRLRLTIGFVLRVVAGIVLLLFRLLPICILRIGFTISLLDRLL